MSTNMCDIGLVGLAVMGQNLVLKMNDHGFKVAVYNRTTSKVDEFLAHEAKDTQVVGAYSLEELVGLLKWPRKIMLMVKAGGTVVKMIASLLPYLEEGDIIIDGGNSSSSDTNRRTRTFRYLRRSELDIEEILQSPLISAVISARGNECPANPTRHLQVANTMLISDEQHSSTDFPVITSPAGLRR